MLIDTTVDNSVIRTLMSEVGSTAFERLAGIFIEECDNNCAELTRFLSQENLAAAEIVAHRFKSTARQFGAHGLAEVCQELEQACAQELSQRAHELMSALIAGIPQVRINLGNAVTSALKSG